MDHGQTKTTSKSKPMQINDKTTPTDVPELFRAFGEVAGKYVTEYPKCWSPYKTAEEKVSYQNRLPTEIQPFVREYFRKHMNELLSHQSESTGEYLENTRVAWNRHIEANRQADCFLAYQVKNIFGDWSPKEWRLARRLLTACMDTDHIKVMYSGGIKRKLDSELTRLAERYDLIDSELTSLLTVPSFPTFYLSWANAPRDIETPPDH
jgi:hypothetical protein